MQIVIVGAGTFGASLAWTLARAGEDVTLVDQFEPGDRRATSGGESRLIRCAHGADADYTASARRARELWRELEAETGEELLAEIGTAWFARREDGWEAASERTMTELGIPCERLEPAAAAQLFPSLGTGDLEYVLFEPEAGAVRAQRAVRALARQAVAHGARLVRGRAVPDGDCALLPASAAAAASCGALVDNEWLEGDAIVWACGPWLGGLFGELVPIRVTCQELLFFDGGPAWRSPGVPGWVDFDHAIYGTGDLDELGVKCALDLEGPPLEADADLPQASRTEADVRGYLARRFPALAGAPLKEGRCCRYELSEDSNFIAARHPELERTWIVGGGSGHGFKHGPALAERVADALRGGEPLPERFGLGAREAGRSFRTAASGPA